MTRIELPHISVLSKIDIAQQYGPLEFGLDFYTEVSNIRQLVGRLPAPGIGNETATEDNMTPVQKWVTKVL